MDQQGSIRVAIIGGGCAAMTAAFELSRPEHDGRYKVTVYQMGFRLGGKGASGRGVANRIEEHGLHLWMGFYENAFRLMRECYGELGLDWREAFEPAPDVAVVDRSPRGEWTPWIAHFPPGRGLPGDPASASSPFSVRGYLLQSIGLVMELVRSAQLDEGDAGVEPEPRRPGGQTLAEAVAALLRYGELAGTAAVLEAVQLLSATLTTPWSPVIGSRLVFPLLDQIAAAARRQLASLVAGDMLMRRAWLVIDLILAIVRGSLVHGLAYAPDGFDAINDYEWVEWLRWHGASEESLNSGFVRGIYDLVFAYADGDVRRPQLAAGVALRGSMRMFFTYRGALFWRMTAGMGDVVFAPLYEVCKKRGVRFEFFHRLRNVGLAPDTPGELPHVDRLEFDVQAEVAAADEYQPLVYVHGQPCWPSEPDYAQLVQGATARREGWAFETPREARIVGNRVLHVGIDFDLVVLGIGIGAVPHVCKELLAREPRWRAMCEHGHTAATQALQLWMRESMPQLGWQHPQTNLSGFVAPFDTWADMRHLIDKESWTQPVRSIAYFVSVLPDKEFVGLQPHLMDEHARAAVHDNGVHFLNNDIGALWPNAVDEKGQFRWDILVSHPDQEPGHDAPFTGSERFVTQYWAANVNPSDRYSLSVPGTVKHRVSPLSVHFGNLTVAGDWTQTGLDSGCVESAVMSGLLAAHALSNYPPLESITGYDHP